MSHILAIEPDRRQAARLAAIARVPLNVELVVADSAEHAIAAIAKRVPDLILTSRLLSPKDEAVLDRRLRELDAAGSNVQTLMIPMLASGPKSGGKKEGGLLNRLRRGGDDEPADGCDPSVFAEEISEYLERIAAERALKATAREDAIDNAMAAAPPPPPPDVTPQHGYEAPLQPERFDGELEVVPELEIIADPVVAHEAVVASGREETWQEISLDEQMNEATPDAHAPGAETEVADEAPMPQPADEPETFPIAAMEAVEPQAVAATPQRSDAIVEEFVVDQDIWAAAPATRNDAASSRKPVSVVRRGEDDWGFFDPQRVGFPALLEKLREAAT